MKVKEQFQLAIFMTNFRLMMLLTVIYAVGYGLLFGLIFNAGDWKEVIFQTCLWFLFYTYVFLGLGGGIGIMTIFYTLVSFGKDRKTAFRVWSKTIWINLLFGVLTLIPCAIVGFIITRQKQVTGIFGITFSKNEMDLLQLPLVAGDKIGHWLVIGLILLGIGAFLNIMVAFFCTVGSRFGWQITAGTILLMISLILVLFVADINILFVTGYNIYRYLIGLYGLSAVLYGLTYLLSQKWEVKN